MSTWTVGDEEQYIIKVLKRYDPKVESLVERCHHARLYAIGDAVRTIEHTYILYFYIFSVDIDHYIHPRAHEVTEFSFFHISSLPDLPPLQNCRYWDVFGTKAY